MPTCGTAFSDAVFAISSAEYQCSRDADNYSFFVITAAPSASQIQKICASSSCQQVIQAIKRAQPTECNTGGPAWDFYIYKDILNPIQAGCSATPPATTTPAPPPATTTAAPAPPPTTPAATPAPPATTTAAPPATTAASVASTTTSPTTTTTSPASTTSSPSGSLNQGTGSSEGSASHQSSGSGEGTVNSTNTLAPAQVTGGPSSNSSSTINTTPQSGSGTSSNLIIGLVVGGVLLVAIVAFVAFRMGRNKKRTPEEASYVVVTASRTNNSNNRSRGTRGTYIKSPATGANSTGPAAASFNSNTKSSDGGAGAIGLWSDREIQNARIPLEEIMIGDILSQGAFGEVLRGSYNSETVAIKRLLPARRKDMKEIESFLEEAKLLTTLRHQRIVRFIGVAWDSLTDLCIVSEFMDGGDLRSMLAHADAMNEPTGFSADKVKIALHIIHGLAYLHGLKPAMMHRDLKSKNVLLTRDLDAKLTDFGVSRERAEKTMTAGVGSSMWMAPEVMIGERYDEKADIFSFGVVLSELDTQKLPYAHAVEPGTDRKIPEMAMLNMVSAGRLSVAFTDGADSDMVETGLACVSLDPRQRPSANDLLRRMHHIYRHYKGLI